MFKYSLLLVFVLFTTFSFGQSVELIEPMPVSFGTLDNPDDTEINVKWNVTNATDEDVTVRVKRTNLNQIQGSKNFFCWGVQCYGYDDDESSSNELFLVTLPPGAVDTTFKGSYEHHGNAGCTEITYCFFNHYDDTDITCFDVTYAIDCSVGLEEIKKTTAELSDIGPNPVSGVSSFNYKVEGHHQGLNVTVFNLQGQVVKTIPLNSNSGMVFIDAGEFDAGVYVYSLGSDHGILASKRLIVQ